MADITSGAPSPSSTALAHAAPHSLAAGTPALQQTFSTRTRRNHGVMTIGGQMGAVYSSRRAGALYGVRFELGSAQLTLASDMTPAQARSLARALIGAADAADASKGGSL